MITVPKHFQFRIEREPGYTHTGKIEDEMCVVTWARGFERYYMDKTGTTIFPVTEWRVQEVANQFVNKRWVLVDQPEVKQEDALPDEFYFINSCDNVCHAVANGSKYHIDNLDEEFSVDLTSEEVQRYVQRSYWKIIDKHPLTAEQLRANAEAREQIAALEHNIKLRKQDVEHAQILIANYEGRVKELEMKIAEE